MRKQIAVFFLLCAFLLSPMQLNGQAEKGHDVPNVIESMVGGIGFPLCTASDRTVYYFPWELGGFFLWEGSKLCQLEGDQLKPLFAANQWFIEGISIEEDQYVLKYIKTTKGNVIRGRMEWRDRKSNEITNQFEWLPDEGRYYYWHGTLYFRKHAPDSSLYCFKDGEKVLLYEDIATCVFYPSFFYVVTKGLDEKTTMYIYSSGSDTPIVNHNQALHQIIAKTSLPPENIDEYRAGYYGYIMLNNKIYYVNLNDELCSVEITDEGFYAKKIIPYEGAKARSTFNIDNEVLYIIYDNCLYSYCLSDEKWLKILPLPQFMEEQSPAILVVDDHVYISIRFYDVDQQMTLFYCDINEPDYFTVLFTVPNPNRKNHFREKICITDSIVLPRH